MSKHHSKTNMIDHLTTRYGIPKTWLASQLGLTRQGFEYAIERGLRPEEVEVLEAALQGMGRDLIEFKVPQHLKQKNIKEAA